MPTQIPTTIQTRYLQIYNWAMRLDAGITPDEADALAQLYIYDAGVKISPAILRHWQDVGVVVSVGDVVLSEHEAQTNEVALICLILTYRGAIRRNLLKNGEVEYRTIPQPHSNPHGVVRG